MAVCKPCHEAIHFGGKIKAMIGSLASIKDTGKGNNDKWKKYLIDKRNSKKR
jgi:hypothetical protein